MAHNAIKKYDTAADFHANIRNVLDQWRNNAFRLERLADHLADAAAGDYPDSPLSDLATLRTNLNALLACTEYTTFETQVKTFIRI
jgi:hypothetical protein